MMKIAHHLPFAALLALTVPTMVAAQTKAAPPIVLDEALKMGAEALKAAKAKGRPVSIVIVNREGRVISSMRMDGASFFSLQVAEAKAVTAAAIGAPTEVFEQVDDRTRGALLSLPGVTMVAGGLPVLRGDQTVGGIGVSGGSKEEDVGIAQAALGK
jgi:uncharacterized protein GlcG (DUF336 family)